MAYHVSGTDGIVHAGSGNARGSYGVQTLRIDKVIGQLVALSPALALVV